MFEIIAIRKHAMVRYKYLFIRVFRNLKIKKLGTIINLEKDLIFASSANGTNFRIGDAGILRAFEEITGIKLIFHKNNGICYILYKPNQFLHNHQIHHFYLMNRYWGRCFY